MTNLKKILIVLLTISVIYLIIKGGFYGYLKIDYFLSFLSFLLIIILTLKRGK